METLRQQPKIKKNIAPVQYKSLTVKDANIDEESRKVSGYLSVFGVKDSDGDILIKGCFAKSINERGPASNSNGKIAFCWQHDMKDPIGPFSVLKEDDYGLYFESVLDDPESVPSAKRALAQLKSGTLNQFSIGFMYVWDKIEYDESLDAFIVKEVTLFEGSVVTLGANSFTYFAGMKSEQKEQAETDLRKETESFIKSLPKEVQYQTRQLITKHIALAQSQPGKPLTEERKPPFDLDKAIQETKFFN
jgi:HK97 family phage prohead protease